MADFHKGRQIAQGGTEFFALGPFNVGDLIEGVQVVVGSSEAARHTVGVGLHGVREETQAALNASNRLLSFSEVSLGDVPAIPFWGQASSPATLLVPVRRVVRSVKLVVLVGVANGNATQALDVFVSAWGSPAFEPLSGPLSVEAGGAPIPAASGPPPSFGGGPGSPST